LRRSSAISSYTAAAAVEALGARVSAIQSGQRRLGIVFTALTGCVAYSRRFFDEVLTDPATASPIVFPETVFNAPSSHLAAYLQSTAINYTLIGDPGTFLQGLALAADWLMEDRVDVCVVVGAEELDWLVAAAQGLFDSDVIVSEGSGALVLERASNARAGVQLECITEPVPYTTHTSRHSAAQQVRQLITADASAATLIDSLTGAPRLDSAEALAWADWQGPRLSVKTFLGESFAAASAWQCVLAADQVHQGVHSSAVVNVVGCNEQAIAARLRHPSAAP
jgi:3-oxoacyl-(acyl-carrier-protein) synthase